MYCFVVRLPGEGGLRGQPGKQKKKSEQTRTGRNGRHMMSALLMRSLLPAWARSGDFEENIVKDSEYSMYVCTVEYPVCTSFRQGAASRLPASCTSSQRNARTAKIHAMRLLQLVQCEILCEAVWAAVSCSYAFQIPGKA